MENSLCEMVNGEVDFMKSAYSEEFEDLREQDAWKVYRPPDVRVTLGPHHSQGGTLHSHVKVVLRITTSEKYPHQKAEVILESCDGLSSKELEILDDQLQGIAESCAQQGSVVMLELCQHAQTYLSEHARPYSECIYDEMVAGQKARMQANEEAEEEKRRQKELEEEERRTIMKEEIARVTEELKEEERQRKEQRFRPSFMSDVSDEKSSAENCESPSRRMKSRSLSECTSDSGSRDKLVNHDIRFLLPGKQECKVKVTGHIAERKHQGCCVLEAIDESTRGKRVIYQWNVRAKRTGRKGNHIKVGQQNQLDDLYSKVSTLEKDMSSSLLRLEHENLVLYLGMKVSLQQNERIVVDVLQDFVQGTSLRYYLDQGIILNEPFIRHISEGTLQALNYLHQNNVVHRDLRESCIFLDNLTKKVRVADFGVERRIVEAVMEFIDAECPSLYPSSPGRGGKKGDVYRFGLIILSLSRGERLKEVIPSIPDVLGCDLTKFIQRCLELNEQERWTADRLLGHSFIQEETSDKEKNTNGIRAKEASPNKGEQQEEGASGEEDMESLSEVSLYLPSNLKGFSRVKKEYSVLAWLGRGGFGHVFKVRNLVDDRIYALKRIPLHQQREAVRSKILREVTILSSLNHENVVRYYTAWIEELTQDGEDESTTMEEDLSEEMESQTNNIDITPGSEVIAAVAEDSSGFTKSVTADAGGEESEWSIIFEHDASRQKVIVLDDFEEESDEEDADDWLMGRIPSMQRDLFEDSEDSQPEECLKKYTEGGDETDNVGSANESVPAKKFQFLYIQMQLCEKNTLRQAINDGLYLDEDRRWRLFREMVNGLDYIHTQGLIHRDLKPGNIFLDSGDHVKIGDFGLATAAIKVKTTVPILKSEVEESKDSVLTGHVGTMFYIAPEVTKSAGKVNYTNKVDIYSLGVIFFEMIHPPLTTGMEKVKVLSDIRKPTIQFPPILMEKKFDNCREVISWLLQQDPQVRPSATDILKSQLLPPPTAEEQKFMSMLDAKLSNVRSSNYQDILNRVFNPCARPELEATFEVKHNESSDYWLYWKQNYLHSLVEAIFKAHGGLWMPTPFYIPKGSFYGDKDNLVSLMSRRGELVSAQYELRYPFARYIARNGIKLIRRYCIDRVQRAYKVSGIHPKESYECAFDIVTSKRGYTESAARVMLVAHDIIQKIMSLYQLMPDQGGTESIVIQVGHMDLVRAILSHCGIEDHLHEKVICLLRDWNSNRLTPENFGEYLQDLKLTRASAETLKGFLSVKGTIEDVAATLNNKGLTSRRKTLVPVVRQTLEDLKEIVETAVILGVKFEIIVKPLMVADAQLYCGFICQFLMDVRKKRTQMTDLLAQGGSYEYLIAQHRSRLVAKKSEELPSAVGVSLFLEKFAGCISDINRLIAADEGDVNQTVCGLGCGSGIVTVMVCAVGPKQLKERVDIVTRLRAVNITADHCHHQTQEEVESLMEDLCVPNLVILMSSEKAAVRISNDSSGQRILERKIKQEQVADFVIKNLGVTEAAAAPVFSRTDSKMSGVTNQDEYNLNIQYITKKQSKSKDAPKLDQQITRDVQNALISRWSSIGSNTMVDVWAVEMEKKALLAMGMLDIDSNVKNFTDTVSDIKSMFPTHKDHIDEICKLLQRRIFQRKKSEQCLPLIFYSIPSYALKRII